MKWHSAVVQPRLLSHSLQLLLLVGLPLLIICLLIASCSPVGLPARESHRKGRSVLQDAVSAKRDSRTAKRLFCPACKPHSLSGKEAEKAKHALLSPSYSVGKT